MDKLVKYLIVGVTEWTPQPDVIKDTYWSGSAPLCLGGCKAQHQELMRHPCGDSSCCWLGYKSLCRGEIATKMTIELLLSDPPAMSFVSCFAFPLH